jgi:dCMP deaminase
MQIASILNNLWDIINDEKRHVLNTIVEKFEDKNNERPSWDLIWMHMAETIALRSCDPRFKVGAVIVSDDNTQVLSLGYNGNYAGGPNFPESNEPGKSGFIHAEVNALLKLDYNNPKRKLIYLTLAPCVTCAKCLINAGIDEVVYREVYRNMEGVQLLKNSGVIVRQFKKS